MWNINYLLGTYSRTFQKFKKKQRKLYASIASCFVRERIKKNI